MKLRSRLFLGISGLLAVALLGLVLGLYSVLQLTDARNGVMSRNLSIIESSQGLGQELSTQVTLLLAENLDRTALATSDQSFKGWLDGASISVVDQLDREAITAIQLNYAAFQKILQRPYAGRSEFSQNVELAAVIAAMRNRINAVQNRYVDNVKRSTVEMQGRATLIATLLGLVIIAVLLIGLVIANSFAQRIGRPIEALARAADRIGKGDFRVMLPISKIAELRVLSRRFGLMADSLQSFKNSDLAALQAGQKRLKAVLDSMDGGLLIFNRDGSLEHVNPVAQRQLGCAEQDLGLRLGELLDYPELDEQLSRVLQGDTREEGEQDLRVVAGGEPRVLSYSLSSVSNDEGCVLCAVMVLRDVTDQRAFERVRSEFVLRASHELRTPVAGMHMAFALLRERLKLADDGREADLAQTVDEEMRRLVHLINELLNFSRYQSGLQKIEPAPCDVEGLLLQAHHRFASQALEQGIDFEVELSSELPGVDLDHLKISRVLDNLIANALRHTKKGGHVTLQGRRKADRLVMQVEDDGEGIPYSQQARVFEPFAQVSHKRGGVGLGLALCKEIVLLHGGSIGMESTPGHGSRFIFSLPL
ncbi:MAG: NtrC-family two-component system sensor histidine kinase KinB [Halopseudomonas sp.]|uniref:ATP-binding protein n=1 Tax=Halopseudomonas sp. TaxID=2901191 RepID=UPI0039E3AB7A